MASAILIQTTSSDKEVLTRIASELVKQKLAACCQISGPIESHYHWEDKLESSSEWICNVKTTKEAGQSVFQTIRLMHNYDLPEILSFDISGGDPDYLKWIENQVEASPEC